MDNEDSRGGKEKICNTPAKAGELKTTRNLTCVRFNTDEGRDIAKRFHPASCWTTVTNRKKARSSAKGSGGGAMTYRIR
jgi:hypothetical protein